jgi:hypothetical protein
VSALAARDRTWPPPGLDPALPDLATTLTPAAVARGFERPRPGACAPPAIRSCVLEHVRWSPGVECEAVYRITTSHTAVPTAGTVTVRPEGVEHRLLTADAGLPGLAAATDAARMRVWLAGRLGHPVDVTSITPVSYRPGSRCMLRYELRGGGSATRVYGKVLAPAAYEALAAAAAALGGVLAPPLLGIAPEWRLVVQTDTGGHSLRSLAAHPLPTDALSGLRAGGRLLARLHARSHPAGPRRTLAGDALALRQLLAVMERVSPPTAARFAEGVGRLASLPGSDAPAVPGHGALRLDQIHIGAGGPVFIDLDSSCRAEPARDLGNLLAYLRWREIRQPAAAGTLTAVRGAFLEGYAAEAGAAADPVRVGLHQAATSLKIAGRCLQKLAVEEWEQVPRLVEVALDGLGAAAGPAW